MAVHASSSNQQARKRFQRLAHLGHSVRQVRDHDSACRLPLSRSNIDILPRPPALDSTACLAIMVVTRHTVPDPRVEHLVTLAAGTLVGVMAFLLAAKVIGIPEVRNARALLAA
ncbi:hypothetical protein F3087_39805 [Nocardia colli]|uniref:Uncharacterized protein n=1 Tax=Nocardia colli TaxID=2545717 RepID=A0A5N0E014_9NOCA|nr:hypothetical protein [Nocardia colli]KAA8881980.1 hypothetical protein F3087_39805 [Nocardia colli]